MRNEEILKIFREANMHQSEKEAWIKMLPRMTEEQQTTLFEILKKETGALQDLRKDSLQKILDIVKKDS
ncbi:MAG: hypothetical protein WC730_03875 [Patescibacteria group bacterium]|jgi:hypothetical protein